MSEFTGENAFRILLASFTEQASDRDSTAARIAGLSSDLAGTQEALAEARDDIRRAKNEHQEDAKKAAEGIKLWKAADSFLRSSQDIASFSKNLDQFREIVASTGDAGLDPDAIPF